jgi:uncharacterized protein YijF (DUF1287 family)
VSNVATNEATEPETVAVAPMTPEVAVTLQLAVTPDFSGPTTPIIMARLPDELVAPPIKVPPVIAALPPEVPMVPEPSIATTPTLPSRAIEVATSGANTAFCSAPPSAAWQRANLKPGAASKPQPSLITPSGMALDGNPAALGARISEAALAQINELVIYRAAYTRIAYPMGDVSPLFGVCTDVIIRALRDVGIDLQEQVQVTRSGNGDTNIDHRRVETLKRYFAKHGETLPISEFAEDYRPGDIVTYFRPWNRSTTTHIAVVSHVIAPSGRPMIVHNRGWGAQLEDALLVDRITGHFRVSSAASIATASTTGSNPGSATAKIPVNKVQVKKLAAQSVVGNERR